MLLADDKRGTAYLLAGEQNRVFIDTKTGSRSILMYSERGRDRDGRLFLSSTVSGFIEKCVEVSHPESPDGDEFKWVKIIY